jgi:pyruvate formate lyase activating enzyme
MTPGTETLESRLRSQSVTASPELVRSVEGKPDWVQCLACGHACRIPPGQPGICRIRFNTEGRLLAPSGYVASLAVDPIEKKPFFHVLPGSDALSFGMLGCDLHCGYCQNWITSQALRDPSASAPTDPVAARDLVDAARRAGAPAIISTYNEPLITAEWAHTVFTPARTAGLLTGFVSNGNGTPEVLDYLRPVTELFKVDLKCYSDGTYRKLGTVLANVLRTLEGLKERGFWVEVVTLLVPGFNDDEGEIRELAGFLARLDPLIPWHVTAFRSDYRMSDTPSTSVEQLLRAAEIGAAAGLRYVYAGNRPAQVGGWEDTRCHGCGSTLVKRSGFFVREQRIEADGRCPDCATAIPGVWRRPEA